MSDQARKGDEEDLDNSRSSQFLTRTQRQKRQSRKRGRGGKRKVNSQQEALEQQESKSPEEVLGSRIPLEENVPKNAKRKATETEETKESTLRQKRRNWADVPESLVQMEIATEPMSPSPSPRDLLQVPQAPWPAPKDSPEPPLVRSAHERSENEQREMEIAGMTESSPSSRSGNEDGSGNRKSNGTWNGSRRKDGTDSTSARRRGSRSRRGSENSSGSSSCENSSSGSSSSNSGSSSSSGNSQSGNSSSEDSSEDSKSGSSSCENSRSGSSSGENSSGSSNRSESSSKSRSQSDRRRCSHANNRKSEGKWHSKGGGQTDLSGISPKQNPQQTRATEKQTFKKAWLGESKKEEAKGQRKKQVFKKPVPPEKKENHEPMAMRWDDREETDIQLDTGGLTWEWIVTAELPTLKHIPKGARREWGEVLKFRLKKVAENPEREAEWQLLFALPKLCLRNPPRGGRARRHQTQTSRWVAEKLLKAKRGMWKELWEEANACLEDMQQKQKPRSARSGRQWVRDRVISLVAEGQYSRACKALVSRGVCEFDANVEKSLQEKHPQKGDWRKVGELGKKWKGDEGGRLEFSPKVVEKALKSFPKGSAPGGSGCRAQHWLDGLDGLLGDMREDLGKRMTTVCEILANGEAPREIAKWIAGAPVYPLKKKGGGIRPVAVGEMVRRLVARLLANDGKIKQKAADLFREVRQLGVGVKGGAEIVVQGMRTWLRRKGKKGWGVLKLDFENAYNTIDRGKVGQMVQKEFPELWNWFEYCYGVEGILTCEGHILPFGSSDGVQQGDPLAPLFFALGILTLGRKLKQRLKEGMALWYLDDGSVAGPGEELVATWDFLQEEARKVGLQMNVSKCEVWGWRGEESEWMKRLPAEIKRVQEDGFELLGAPIGSKKFSEAYAEKRLQDIEEALVELRKVDDAQVELALLRSCLGFPRFGFTLRSAPPHLIEKAAAKFDALMERVAGDRFQMRMDNDMKLQWTLPIRLGGVGIPTARDVAAPAYLGNAMLALPYVQELFEDDEEDIALRDMEGVEEAWRWMVNTLEEDGGELDPEAEKAIDEWGLGLPDEMVEKFCQNIDGVNECIPEDEKHQHFLHSLIHIKRMRQWLSGKKKEASGLEKEQGKSLTHRRDLMRKLAVMRGDEDTGYVGSWLNVVPCEALGTKINTPTYLTMLRFWMGASVWQRGQCQMKSASGKLCGTNLDKWGDHAVMCKTGPGVISRHDVMNKAWFRLEVSAGFNAKMEQRISGWSRKRPADTLVTDWKGDKWCVQDWVITHLMTKKNLMAKLLDPNAAVEEAENRKEKLEKKECEKVGMEFLPLAMDTFGGIGPKAKEALMTIANEVRRMKNEEEEDKGSETKRMAQKLRLKCLKAVANQILYRSCVGELEEGTKEEMEDESEWPMKEEDNETDGEDEKLDVANVTEGEEQPRSEGRIGRRGKVDNRVEEEVDIANVPPKKAVTKEKAKSRLAVSSVVVEQKDDLLDHKKEMKKAPKMTLKGNKEEAKQGGKQGSGRKARSDSKPGEGEPMDCSLSRNLYSQQRRGEQPIVEKTGGAEWKQKEDGVTMQKEGSNRKKEGNRKKEDNSTGKEQAEEADFVENIASPAGRLASEHESSIDTAKEELQGRAEVLQKKTHKEEAKQARNQEARRKWSVKDGEAEIQLESVARSLSRNSSSHLRRGEHPPRKEKKSRKKDEAKEGQLRRIPVKKKVEINLSGSRPAQGRKQKLFIFSTWKAAKTPALETADNLEERRVGSDNEQGRQRSREMEEKETAAKEEDGEGREKETTIVTDEGEVRRPQGHAVLTAGQTATTEEIPTQGVQSSRKGVRVKPQVSQRWRRRSKKRLNPQRKETKPGQEKPEREQKRTKELYLREIWEATLRSEGLKVMDVGQGRGGECQYLTALVSTDPTAWRWRGAKVQFEWRKVDSLRRRVASWLRRHADYPLPSGITIRENALASMKGDARAGTKWRGYLQGVRFYRLQQWGDENTLVALSGVLRRPIYSFVGGQDEELRVYESFADSPDLDGEGTPLLFGNFNNRHFTPLQISRNGGWRGILRDDGQDDARLIWQEEEMGNMVLDTDIEEKEC